MKASAAWTVLAPDVKKFVYVWTPERKATALVCVVHGLGEHGGRYDRLAAEFVKAGMAVVAFDQQGHGRSPEHRGQIRSYGALLDDLETFLTWSQGEFPGLPVTLFGHSMGGNLVLSYAMRKTRLPAAVIASSPMIRAMREPVWWTLLGLRALLPILPNKQLASQIIPERLMSDPEEQSLLVADELFHNRLSLRLGAGLLDSGRWILKHARKLTTPTLLTHGTNDYLTSHLATEQFAELAGEVCHLKLYEEQLHDTFRCLDRAQVIQDFIDFIRRHGVQGGT